MPRIPTRILTSAPQGSANPAAVTARSMAPSNVRVLGPAQPFEQTGNRQLTRMQTAVTQALGQSKARFDADNAPIPGVTFPVALAGLTTVTNASATVSWTINQTLAAGTWLTFPAQPGVVYRLANAVAAAASGTLTTNYTGTSSSTTGTGVLTPVVHRLGRPFVGAFLVNARNAFLSYQVCRNADTRLDAFQVLIGCANRVIGLSGLNAVYDQTPVVADVVVY